LQAEKAKNVCSCLLFRIKFYIYSKAAKMEKAKKEADAAMEERRQAMCVIITLNFGFYSFSY
jgi:hypothetical protein